jgi:hypothetical protein
MKYLCKGYIKNDTIFEPLMDFFFVTTFQNCESEHDHGHCGLLMHKCMVKTPTKQLKTLWIDILHVIMIN